MTDTSITRIKARQVYDSRANPTVEVDVELGCGATGRGTVPSGASTGRFEALELRDGDRRLSGKSVYKAIANIEREIAPALIGRDALDQAAIDRTMIEIDGTPNKSRLGANAILAVSMAVAWAAAAAHRQPLYEYLAGGKRISMPVPMIQVIGGGMHANHAIDVQDFLVIPVGASSFTHAIEMAVDVYHGTRRVYAELGKPVAIADEGGFWPFFESNVEGVELLLKGIEAAGYRPGDDIAIALDIASSHFYENDRYNLALEGRTLSSREFTDVLAGWVDAYPILSIEDGMAEDDWDGWTMLSDRLRSRVQLIGDDLFVTNPDRIRRGIAQGVGNSVLIKMNQVGTLTETLTAIQVTKDAGYLPVISARSGETEDTTILHLAIATDAGQLKVGSVARSERNVKWNEGIRIEEVLGQATYPGRRIFPWAR